MNLNPNLIKDMAANPAVFSRAQSFYNFGATIHYYITYDKVDDYQVFAEVIEDPDLYHVHLTINEEGKVLQHQCNCGGFHTRFGSCKHVIAVLLRLYDDQVKNKLIIHSGLDENEDLIHHVLDLYESHLSSELSYTMYPQDVKLYPKLVIDSKNRTFLECSLGIKRPYVIRDFFKFVTDLECEYVVSYGKELEFKHTIQHFDEHSQQLVQFICHQINENEVYLRQYRLPIPQVRQLFLTPASFDDFYQLNLRQTIACEIDDFHGEAMTLYDKNPNLEFRLDYEEDHYYLRHNLGTYILLKGQNYTYLIQEREVYRCHSSFVQKVIPLLEKMSEVGTRGLKISTQQMGRFLSLVLPKIKSYVKENNLNDLYQTYQVYPLTVAFYLDSEFRGDIGLRVQYRYGEVYLDAHQPNPTEDKKILRDAFKEAKILALLEALHFEKTPKGTYLLKDETAIYHFLTQGIEDLKQIGEVFASETFKGIKIKSPTSLSVGIRLQSDWLKIHFEDLEFEAAEYKKILAAYRQNKKYIRLKDGSFMNLQNDYVETLASLVDDLQLKETELAQCEMTVPKFRALYLNELIQHHDTLKAVKDPSFISMIEEFNKGDEADFSTPPSLQPILRRYQTIGFKWIKTLTKYQMGGILADDMGLGKTLQMISVLLSEQDQSSKPSLIVAPSSLIYNWKSEIEKFAPSLKVLIVAGDPMTRQMLIKTSPQFDIIITSYDLIRRDIETYETQVYRFCILDEAHFIKNHLTQNAKSVKRIQSEVRFALTGTPIENSLADLWSIFDFILPGYFGSYSQFKKQYEAPIVKHQQLHLLTRIHQQVAPFILRRLKKDVLTELPDKIETNVYCEMNQTQRDLYLAMLSQMKQEMNHEISEVGIERSRIKILSLLMRLRQLCCHPSLYLENYRGESAKLNLCLQLVQDCIASGHKILIFSQFTSMLEILGRELKTKKISFLTLTGETKTTERLALTEQFNTDNTQVFLISLKAGGTGLNLTGADVVIHYDPWWNMSAQNQATDRAHRLGQEKTVQVFKLMVKDTIEERIQLLQEQKRDLTEAIVKEGETFINKLSNEELKALFDFHDEF